jgi:hypothetical protein
MSTARLFTITTALTVGAVVVWGVKALVIGLAGGLDQSPLESPLFFLGLVLYVSGLIAIGLAVTAGHSVAVRIVGAVAAVGAGFVAFLVVDAIVAGMAPETDPHWVWAEAQLWISSVATAAAWFVLRNRAAPVSPIAT